MNKTIEEIIKVNVPKNGKVILAFSGGPDSVFLLHQLLKIKQKYPFNIVIAHFNHKLRGKESDKDENFSKKIAEKYKIDYETGYSDIKIYAKQNSLNIEEAARNKRYSFLERIRKKHNANFIITAHHLDDNIETFLLNFLRGTSIRGLKSMQVRNNFILRPLLHTSKNDILEFLKKNKLPFRIDKSNEDLSFNRNKIRHKVVPYLKEIQPKINKVFLRNWENIAELFNYIDDSSEKWINRYLNKENEIFYSNFSNLNPALKKIILQKIYEKINRNTDGLNTTTLSRILNIINRKKTGKEINFGKKFKLVTTSKGFRVIQKKPFKKIARTKVGIPGNTNYKYGEIKTTLLNKKPGNIKNAIYIDYSRVKKPLYVRSRKDGDKFSPFGMDGTKKIKNLFIDKKIPSYKRSEIPVIVDKSDNIISIGANTIADNYKISEETKKILKITVKVA